MDNKQQQLKNLSIYGVISQILLKSFSHNIGSHVLVYVKQKKLGDLASTIIGEVNPLLDFCQSFYNDIKKINESYAKSGKEIETLPQELYNSLREDMPHKVKRVVSNKCRWGPLEYIEDAKILYEYISQRIYYLSQVVTGEQSYTLSISFMKEMMRHFLSQRLLLDGIAAYEGLRGYYYENEKYYYDKNGRIRFHIINLINKDDLWEKKHTNIEKRIKEIYEKSPESILLYSSPHSIVNIENDIGVAIPGGINGQHAFYTILENIIRNAAKHDYKGKGDLEVVIEFRDDNVNNYLFRVYTNMSNKEIIPTINKYLQDEFVIDGKPNLRYLGLKDMVVAVAFLNQQELSHISESGHIEACESPISTLSYNFHLKRPKTVGIVIYNDN